MSFQSASCVIKSDALHMSYILYSSVHKTTLLLNGKTFGSIKTTHWPQTACIGGHALLRRIWFYTQGWISNPTLRQHCLSQETETHFIVCTNTPEGCHHQGEDTMASFQPFTPLHRLSHPRNTLSSPFSPSLSITTLFSSLALPMHQASATSMQRSSNQLFHPTKNSEKSFPSSLHQLDNLGSVFYGKIKMFAHAIYTMCK